jgi:hypothetical protein
LNNANSFTEEERKIMFDILCDNNACCSIGYADQPLLVPFELKSNDFIEFARQDLIEKTNKSLVNALSNVKRAIDCRVASLLFFFGMYRKSKRDNWNFPKSADFLVEIGVLAPNILKKINQKRNDLEHEFKKPSYDEVLDFIDVASLFLENTDRFIQRTYTDFEINKRKKDFPWISIELSQQMESINILLWLSQKEKKTFAIKNTDEENYMNLLKSVVKQIKNS